MPVNKVRRRGSYAPLSAHYYKDDKLIRAGEKAELLYVRALAFCSDVLNDGVITDAQLAHVGVGLSAVKARARSLVAVGAWRRVDGGYEVTAWLAWNKSREDILEDNRKDAGRKVSQSPDQPLPPEPPLDGMPDSDPYTPPSSERIPNGIQPDSARSPNGFRMGSHARGSARAPSRARAELEPEPEPPLPSGGGVGEAHADEASPPKIKTASRKRSACDHGSRIPDDWTPSAEDRRWVREHCPGLAGTEAAITGEFVRYWRAKPGKDGRKLDWSATFRNWMSRENRTAPAGRGRKPTSADTARAGLDLAARYARAEAEQQRDGQVHQLPIRGAS